MAVEPADEIVTLHVFFESWLGEDGANPVDLAEFARFEETLAADFSMVTPSGARIEREPLVELLHRGRGSRPGLVISIRNVRRIAEEGGLTWVSYEEWQKDDDHGEKGRASVALLERSPAGPRGWIWRFVQETWLPPGEDLP